MSLELVAQNKAGNTCLGKGNSTQSFLLFHHRVKYHSIQLRDLRCGFIDGEKNPAMAPHFTQCKTQCPSSGLQSPRFSGPWLLFWPYLLFSFLAFSIPAVLASAISLAHWYTRTSLGFSQISARLTPIFPLSHHSHPIISRRPALTTLFKIVNYLPYSLTPYFLLLLLTVLYLLMFYIIYLFVPFKISFFPLLTEK